MKKILFAIMVVLLLNISLVFAHEHNFDETKQLIDSGISCDQLTDEQLESTGDYYMEQMHPGEAHEMMDQMMGVEGSDSLKQMHIQMAKRLYCNEDVSGMMGGGMMNMMMGSNMMSWQTPQTNMMQGMMGNNPIGFGYNSWGFWNIIWLLLWIGIIVLIIWLVYKFIIKREAVSETPINILKKRFVKGEINKKQFEEMKKEIGE